MDKALKALWPAYKSRHKTLNLNNVKLEQLPPDLKLLTCLEKLSAKDNNLTDVPDEIACLHQKLQCLNLGNNDLWEFPRPLLELINLRSLHLFGNNICGALTSNINSLTLLTTLNLNSNELTSIPPEIGQLIKLKTLSLKENRLSELPRQIGRLCCLEFLYLNNNKIRKLPDEISELCNLKALHVADNMLETLPITIGDLKGLQELEVSINRINAFPIQLGDLKNLVNFWHENNPLQKCLPIDVQCEYESLSLRELAIRAILKLKLSKGDFPEEIKVSLQKSKRCAQCDDPFVDAWLECIQFVTVQKKVGSQKKKLPMTAKLCSWRCFEDRKKNNPQVALMGFVRNNAS